MRRLGAFFCLNFLITLFLFFLWGGGGGGVRNINIFGGMKILCIFFLVSLLCILWSFLKVNVQNEKYFFGVLVIPDFFFLGGKR